MFWVWFIIFYSQWQQKYNNFRVVSLSFFLFRYCCCCCWISKSWSKCISFQIFVKWKKIKREIYEKSFFFSIESTNLITSHRVRNSKSTKKHNNTNATWFVCGFKWFSFNSISMICLNFSAFCTFISICLSPKRKKKNKNKIDNSRVCHSSSVKMRFVTI